LKTICLCWLWTMIFLISVFWVARITGTCMGTQLIDSFWQPWTTCCFLTVKDHSEIILFKFP
jgi:hypothetical protein